MDDEMNSVPLEGKVYGEVSGWMTVLGIIIALIGILISLISGNSIFNYDLTIRDLLRGCEENTIWARDTIFQEELYGYWFMSKLNNGDGIAMFGIAVAIYGGIVGMFSLLISMFRSKETLFYKKGLYTLLALLVTLIMLYYAWRAQFAL